MNYTKNLSAVSSISAKVALLAAVILTTAIPLFASADTLNRQLDLGATGADVTSLQTFLSQNSTVYPQALVTGYYGSLTQSAVTNFQNFDSLDPVGRVGPATLSVLNYQMSVGVLSNGVSAFISNASVNLGRTAATVNWTTDQLTKGTVYYSTSPLTLNEHPYTVDISGNTASTDANLHTSQNVTLSNLNPNTTYYYSIYVVDGAGNVSMSWPAMFTTTS